MKINLELKQIWCDPHLRDYFFRQQAENKMEELLRRAFNSDVLEQLEETYEDFDSLEEELYSAGAEEIARYSGISLQLEFDELELEEFLMEHLGMEYDI